MCLRRTLLGDSTNPQQIRLSCPEKNNRSTKKPRQPGSFLAVPVMVLLPFVFSGRRLLCLFSFPNSPEGKNPHRLSVSPVADGRFSLNTWNRRTKKTACSLCAPASLGVSGTGAGYCEKKISIAHAKTSISFFFASHVVFGLAFFFREKVCSKKNKSCTRKKKAAALSPPRECA